MADELGRVVPDGDLLRGALPERLVELMMCYADVVRAASPWMVGEVSSPLIQLEDLGAQLRGLESATAAVIEEALSVHGETKRRRAAAQAALGA